MISPDVWTGAPNDQFVFEESINAKNTSILGVFTYNCSAAIS